MNVEIRYNGFAADKNAALCKGIADAFGCATGQVSVLVAPPYNKIPLCADWRVLDKGVADMVAMVNGEQKPLEII